MIVHGPLSFIYHVTMVPAFREELHTDVREALRRFEIEELCVSRGQKFDDFLRASLAIERAAFNGRSTPKGNLKKGMAQAATDIFTQCVPHMIADAASPGARADLTIVPAPKDPNAERLLTCVTLLYYSPAFRDSNPSCPGKALAGLPEPMRLKVAEAWSTLHTALQNGGGNVTLAVTELCTALAFEYGGADDPNWKFCW